MHYHLFTSKQETQALKVLNTRKINDRIISYTKREQLNTLIGVALAAPISMGEIVFKDPLYLTNSANYFQKNMAKDGIIYTDDEAMIAMMISSVANESLNAPSGEIPLPEVILNDITKLSKVFHKGYFDENPYLKNIQFENQSLGDFKLSHSSYAKYELMMYSTPENKYNGVMIPRIGTFDHKFKYPSIEEKNHTWMSVTPNEIFTMAQPIKEACGNVLTLGCGMGYYAYMVSEKEEVSHVTIVEKEPEVIELFATYILPQFGQKEKITIIQADAFDYMNELEDGVFNYCFADIWLGNTDTIPYLKLKRICKKFKQTTMAYWIEDALIATIIGYVYTIILNEYYKNQGIPTPPMPTLQKDDQYKLDFLKDLLKDAEVTEPDHVDYYMDYRNIIELMN